MVDPAAFRAGLEELCATFGRDCSDALVSAWYKALGAEFTDAEWQGAVDKAVGMGRSMPTPVEFPRPTRLHTPAPPSPDAATCDPRIHIAEARRILDQIETRTGKVLGFAHGSKRG